MQPKTIAELRQWYTDHNLPPENVTRFFIGKNIKEPKAFGIYEEDGIFIVYKNKDTGERFIRYQGPDEAKAVTELLDRLKKEILNQKAHNGNAESANSGISKVKSIVFTLIATIAVASTVVIPFTLWEIEESKKPESYSYYYADDNHFFYYDGYNYRSGGESSYQWYKYSFEQRQWALDVSFKEDDSKSYPEGINKDTPHGALYTLEEYLGKDYEEYNIKESHAYIDDSHHYPPDEGYYEVGDNIYYYLDDDWGGSYGDGDNSGWYQYDGNDWCFYSTYDDKKLLDENLWYKSNNYYKGTDYGSLFNQNGMYERLIDFGSTDWYQKEKEAEEAHRIASEKRKEESSSNKWDDDDDYSWDSGSSWDSGNTDWSSDW